MAKESAPAPHSVTNTSMPTAMTGRAATAARPVA